MNADTYFVWSVMTAIIGTLFLGFAFFIGYCCGWADARKLPVRP